MKKLSAIMFFLSLIMIGCTENRVLISELTEEGRLMYYQGEPFTGVAFEMHNESQLKEENHFKDGILHGEFKSYHKNGQLEGEGTYKDGKSDGVAKFYYDNGQLESEGAFNDGKYDGVFKKYSSDGQLEMEITFKDGVKIK